MAYIIKKTTTTVKLPYLPKHGKLKDGLEIVLDWYTDEDESSMHEILQYIVNEEGDSYPQDDLSDVADFRAFYLSHDVFVCKDKSTGEVLGGFYVKPNFPGICSHICNGAFALKKSARGKGIGSFLVENYLPIARDLGYLASMFNLVFATNKPAVNLWRKFGFKEIGRIPKAGNLKGKGYTDAIQFYYDLSTVPKTTEK